MAIAAERMSAPPMTYEDYMAEGEVFKRYDIIDGVRIEMNPTRKHQEILMNILEALRGFQRTLRSGSALLSPCDILIRKSPLNTRQPDLSFISNAQLAVNGSDDNPAPLEHAPELVIKILSPSETHRARERKLIDYCNVGVLESWVVDPAALAVEVFRLSVEGYEVVAIYRSGESIHSITFPDLTVSVDSIFAA